MRGFTLAINLLFVISAGNLLLNQAISGYTYEFILGRSLIAAPSAQSLLRIQAVCRYIREFILAIKGQNLTHVPNVTFLWVLIKTFRDIWECTQGKNRTVVLSVPKVSRNPMVYSFTWEATQERNLIAVPLVINHFFLQVTFANILKFTTEISRLLWAHQNLSLRELWTDITNKLGYPVTRTYCQTPIVRQPFFGKQCFSVRYFLATPSENFRGMSKFWIYIMMKPSSLPGPKKAIFRDFAKLRHAEWIK